MRQEIGESVVRHRGTVDGLRITVPKRLKGIKEQIKLTATSSERRYRRHGGSPDKYPSK